MIESSSVKPDVDRRYARARIRQVGAMLFVYAIFYVCRLAFSASKNGMIEQGASSRLAKALNLQLNSKSLLWYNTPNCITRH